MKKYLLLLLCCAAAFNASAAEQSCTEQVGAERAAELVKQCLNVSPATRPPCNAANSCAMIQGEIERGCGFLKNEPNLPEYCKPSQASPQTQTLTGKLLDGGGIDDLSVTVRAADGKEVQAYCDGKCGDWFEDSTDGSDGQSLSKSFKGKMVTLSIVTERNGDRIAGPGEDEALVFIKSAELVK